MSKTTVKELLKQPPPEGSVKRNEDGIEYIPVTNVLELLDSVFSNWSLRDFRFQVIKVDNKYYADCSLTLNVSETVEMSSRALTGTATFQITSQDKNQNYSAISTSLAICNAAKKLGNYFGRQLNSVSEESVSVKEKPAADLLARQKFKLHYDEGNYEGLKELLDRYDFGSNKVNF